MKSLIVSHSSRRGGAERVLRLLASGLPDVGIDVLVSTPETGPLTRALVDQGVRTEIAPVRWWTRPTTRSTDQFTNRLRERVERIAGLAMANQADVILTNSMVTCEGALAAALLDLPHAWYVHEMLGTGTYMKPLLGFEPLHRYMDALADVIFTASSAVSEDLCARGIIATDKTRAVNYGLDIPAGLPSPAVSGSRRPHPVVLFPARLTERKGVFTMLEAFVEVSRRVPDATLALAGEASRPIRKAVRRFIAEHQLHKVEMLGFVSDMPACMAAADVVALPSAADPFPVVVLEAMAVAKPVVGTHSGGMIDQVKDGETGWLAPVGDAQVIADRIVHLLQHPRAREQMGAAAQARLRSQFPRRRMLEQVADGLAAITSRRALSSDRAAVAAELLDQSSTSRRVDFEEQLATIAERSLAHMRTARASLRRRPASRRAARVEG